MSAAPGPTSTVAEGMHSVAAGGFASGTNELYDRARPSYPPAALQHIFKSVNSKQGQTYIEPGAGTGIFSRLLLSPPSAEYPAFKPKVLVGVEPSQGMRNQFDKSLSRVPASDLQGVDVRAVEGTFEDLSKAGVGKGEADAVIIAQAWHWAPDYDKSMREVASYLKPGAPLILIWNIESKEDEWHESLRDLYQKYSGNTPQYFKGLWRKMYDSAAYTELYSPAEESQFGWQIRMTGQGIADRILSKSYMTEAYLHGEERQRFLKGLDEILARGPKGEDGLYDYKYNTDVVVVRRK